MRVIDGIEEAIQEIITEDLVLEEAPLVEIHIIMMIEIETTVEDMVDMAPHQIIEGVTAVDMIVLQMTIIMEEEEEMIIIMRKDVTVKVDKLGIGDVTVEAVVEVEAEA